MVNAVGWLRGREGQVMDRDGGMSENVSLRRVCLCVCVCMYMWSISANGGILTVVSQSVSLSPAAIVIFPSSLRGCTDKPIEGIEGVVSSEATPREESNARPLPLPPPTVP